MQRNPILCERQRTDKIVMEPANALNSISLYLLIFIYVQVV